MNYELRVTNYEFEWHADTSRPFSTRFGRFRSKFGMAGSIIGFFLCSRFPGSEILHPSGRLSGVTKAERRETG